MVPVARMEIEGLSLPARNAILIIEVLPILCNSNNIKTSENSNRNRIFWLLVEEKTGAVTCTCCLDNYSNGQDANCKWL